MTPSTLPVAPERLVSMSVAGAPGVGGTAAFPPGTARFAWGLLGYEILVVAWGAYVRASGSGAGCGRHWPTCNGDIIPRAPRIETLIELSHRLSSGGALIGTLVLLVLAIRAYPRGHRVRRGAWTTAVTAWWASGGGPARLRGQRPVVLTIGSVLFAMLFVGASGAVTALGDTLFPSAPSASLAAGIAQDFAAGAHLFVRLRAIHPMLAVTTAAAIVLTMGAILRRPLARVPENALKFCVGILLSAFGVFWTGEGLGVDWPGADLAIPGLILLFAATALILVRLARPAAVGAAR